MTGCAEWLWGALDWSLGERAGAQTLPPGCCSLLTWCTRAKKLAYFFHACPFSLLSKTLKKNLVLHIWKNYIFISWKWPECFILSLNTRNLSSSSVNFQTCRVGGKHSLSGLCSISGNHILSQCGRTAQGLRRKWKKITPWDKIIPYCSLAARDGAFATIRQQLDVSHADLLLVSKEKCTCVKMTCIEKKPKISPFY